LRTLAGRQDICISKTNRPEHKKWSDTYFAVSYAREAIIINDNCKELDLLSLPETKSDKWAKSKFLKVEEAQLKRLLEIFRKESE
jgi:hypothetical protein